MARDPFPQTSGSNELEMRFRLLYEAVQRIPTYQQRPDSTLQPLLWINKNDGKLYFTQGDSDVDVFGGGTGSGSPYTLTIGSVSTLNAGSSATASITGTSPNQQLNLGIPRGANGSSKPRASITSTVTGGTNVTTDVSVLSVTIPAGTATVGDVFKGEYWGQFNQGTVGATLRLWVKINGTKVVVVTSPLGTTASTNNFVLLKAIATVRAGAVWVNGRGRVKSTDSHMGDQQIVAVDTTQAITFEMGLTYDIADPSVATNIRNAVAWVI